MDKGKMYNWSNAKIYLDGQEIHGYDGIYSVKAVAIPTEVELKDIVFNEEAIREILTSYFKGFFDEMRCVVGKYEGWPAFGFIGKRYGNEFCYSFDIRKWDMEQKDGMIYHWLESIKGEIIKNEQTILLEK